MSTGESTTLDEVDPLRQPVHPCEMLRGEFDDPRAPAEFTIASPEIANYTEWMTAGIESMVFLDEVR